MAPVANYAASSAAQEPTESSAAIGRLSKNLDSLQTSLSSHLRLVESLDSTDKTATTQTVSRILESAQKLVDRFTALRRQLTSIGVDKVTVAGTDAAVPPNPREKLKARKPRPTTKINGKGREGSVDQAESVASEGGGARKRSRESDFSESQISTDQASHSSRKRPRTKQDIPGSQDNVEDFVPVALQKDDISEEVERRLKLKEERRKKASAETDKKRRRESTSSRSGSSSSSPKDRSKRYKNSNYSDRSE